MSLLRFDIFHCSSNLSAPSLIHNQRNKYKPSIRVSNRKGLLQTRCRSLDTKSVPVMERLPFKLHGYQFWTWRGHKIHYVEQGEGAPIILLHGFGASLFHWRYNIPELSKKYKVYAVDLLGFGWSDKPIIEYDAIVWRSQIVDFLKEIVKEPAILVGNSIGGFTALFTAAWLPEQVHGVAVLNSAGQFTKSSSEMNKFIERALQMTIVNSLKEFFQRMILGILFHQSKKPSHIKSVLKSVYINTTNVDDYLMHSIQMPTEDPNAEEVYCRLLTGFMFNQRKYTLDSVLSKLSCPLLLIWGDLDPLSGPSKAKRIKELYPNTELIHLQAGHCPHDEIPETVNSALLNWFSMLTFKA